MDYIYSYDQLGRTPLIPQIKQSIHIAAALAKLVSVFFVFFLMTLCSQTKILNDQWRLQSIIKWRLKRKHCQCVH